MPTLAYRFDFALSFAGAQRDLAVQIRNALRNAGTRVFYDRDYEHEMLGRDGSIYLRKIYSNEARHCLILVSKEYDAGQWPQLERESIQARELRGERGVLIPILVDGHRPDWLPATRIYFDLSSRELADLIGLLTRLLQTEGERLDSQATIRSANAYAAIQARGSDFVTQCRSHLNLALQDGVVRIRLGYPSTKTEAGKALIELGALEIIEAHSTGDRGSKYKITQLGVDILHRLSEK